MDYKIFTDPNERRDLIRYSVRLASYLAQTRIRHLVVVDRSSRPVWLGVKALLDAAGGYGLKIHFVNPQGFVPAGASYVDKIRYEQEIKGNLVDDQPRPQRIIDADVQRLGLPTDEPIALFDTCIHSGHSVKPILTSFARAGLDVRLITVTESENSSLRSDFWLTRGRPYGGCYPWSKDRLVSKTFGSIHSTPNPDPYVRHQARRIRTEIRSIINQALQEVT